MYRSQDEINRLVDQLDDIEVLLKLRIEIRRLVDRIVLHMKIQKFIIYYHTPKWIVRFKSGKSTLFIESDGEMIDDHVWARNMLKFVRIICREWRNVNINNVELPSPTTLTRYLLEDLPSLLTTAGMGGPHYIIKKSLVHFIAPEFLRVMFHHPNS